MDENIYFNELININKQQQTKNTCEYRNATDEA